MGSSRFPGKPLKKILELPLIEHVRRRVSLCDFIDDVYVATCDGEIKDTVESCGGKTIMTSKSHERCTDRIEEAAQKLDADIIVNVQGDEPLIIPELIKMLVEPFYKDIYISATCLIYPITADEELGDVNTVKVVLNKDNSVMYFSRSPIPNFKLGIKPRFFEQSGIMAYEKGFLHKYSELPQMPLERAESIDMLRIIEHGFKIYGVIIENITVQVDFPEHILKVEKILKEDQFQKAFYEKILKL